MAPFLNLPLVKIGDDNVDDPFSNILPTMKILIKKFGDIKHRVKGDIFFERKF